ncbi:MAG: SspB family protein [Alphaproteobacteria bacterium]
MVIKNINYAALIDEAMHIIVKKSLQIAVGNRLPGDHHFFISFITDFPGVTISERLKKKYPKEMTIVLQFQFENLIVNDHEFSVILSFDNIKEEIVIPFMALTAFADPSVKFGLQFRHIDENPEINEDELDTKEIYPEPFRNKAPTENIKTEETTKPNTTNVIPIDKFRKKNK